MLLALCADSDMSPHDSQESGDDDDDALADKENVTDTCPMIEYQALLKELHERNTQRDDLLLKLKVTPKSSCAAACCTFLPPLFPCMNANKSLTTLIVSYHLARLTELGCVFSTSRIRTSSTSSGWRRTRSPRSNRSRFVDAAHSVR